ncbi:MAG: ATP-binding cassette domain-containing protein [Gimesia sp.]|nr:ATP-binding cassette domain-containing protein [Gimesia sp.]
MDLLTFEDVSKAFQIPRQFSDFLFRRPAGTIQAVRSINLEIKQNEILGIAGESGCGKSTTCMMGAGLLNPTSGCIKYCGRDIANMSRADLVEFRKSVQLIFQDPFESLNPRFMIEDIVAEGPRAMKLWPEMEIRKKVSEILWEVGLDPTRFAHRYPHELSGGERQRVGIAAALVCEPKIVIADEPLSMLDVSIRADILDLIKNLAKDRQFSCVYVSHDLSILGNVADRVLIMYLGQAVELGNAKDVIQSPAHPYTRALISSVPIPDPRIDRGVPNIIGDISLPVNAGQGCSFAPRCPYAEAECARRFDALDTATSVHQSACWKSDPYFAGVTDDHS